MTSAKQLGLYDLVINWYYQFTKTMLNDVFLIITITAKLAYIPQIYCYF